MGELAKNISVQNPKALSRPLNALEQLGLVEHEEKDNVRGGIKQKFWSLSPKGERLLAPFWREVGETKPVAPAEKRVDLIDVDPIEAQFYLKKILDVKTKDLVRNEAMRGLRALCREHHVPLGEVRYELILEGFKKLLEKDNEKDDLKGDLLRALEAIAYNSSIIGDLKTIKCIRDNFLEMLKRIQKNDPLHATPALEVILSEEERFTNCREVLRHWMIDIADDETYRARLQSLLQQVAMMYRQKPKETREWLFRLMENPDEGVSSRAAGLHRMLT